MIKKLIIYITLGIISLGTMIWDSIMEPDRLTFLWLLSSILSGIFFGKAITGGKQNGKKKKGNKI